VVNLKKRVKALNVSTMQAIETLTLKEIIGEDEETGEETIQSGVTRAGNLALKGALKDVDRGMSYGKNIKENLASQNEKMRGALDKNKEVFGDLNLGNSLLTDLEKRRQRDRSICKVVCVLGTSIITVLLFYKYYFHK
jgi:hypothetical protein